MGTRGGTTDADFTPPADAVEQMMRYNEELAKSGALISLVELTPPYFPEDVRKAAKSTIVEDAIGEEEH